MADFKLSPDGLYVGANGVVFEDGFSVPGTYHTWRRDYSVNNLNPTDLLYRDGSALPTGGAYRFHAHISGTGTDQSATAVYWNQNGTWKLNVVYQSGTSSNHPEFIIGANGKPQISIDHTSYYTVNIYHEHMQLAEESSGTDNMGGFGADQYMSYVDGLRFNPSGSGTTWNQGYTVWHAGNDGSGSTLDADLLDGVEGSSYLRSDVADRVSGKVNFDYVVGNLDSVSGLDGVTPFKTSFQATNRPGSGNYATGFEFVFDDAGARTQFVAASDGDNSVPSLYVRSEGWPSTDGWHPWYQIWHSGNHGSGSGLDADKLDGLDSSAFLRSDASGTTTGILTTDQVRWGSGAGTYSGNPRSAVIGYSGGNYGQIGYGWIPTTTSNVHTSQINDFQSRVDFFNGIRVYGSGAAVAVGTNVTWTEVLDARTTAFTYKGNTIWHAANDGAGSTLDADLLDGQQGSYYQNASNLTAGTIADARVSGTYSGITLKTDGGNTHFTTPNSGSNSTNDRTVFGLAQYKSDSNAAVGAIVFTAPTTQSTVMHRMRIEGLIHSGGPTVMAVVQGYRTTGNWAQTSKINLGITDIQVRWGVDPTGKNCLILGDVGTTWSYPMMAITHAMFSHSGSSDAYCTGWTVGLVTSLTGYTNVTSTLSNTALNTNISGNAATASAWDTARTLSLTGAVTGSASIDGSGNVSLATTATADPTLTINGDASGSATFTNLGNATLTLTVADDSHNHIIDNVDGLQTALDSKLDLSGGTMTGDLLLSTIRTADGQHVVINAGESSSYATGQTSERLYVNSEQGVEVNTSPDNWGSGWAGRKTTTIKGDSITVDGNPVVVSGTTWSTPSRTPGTIYQNTSGHTLFVIIDSTGNGDYAQVSTNGTSWLNVYNWAGGVGSYERNSLTLVLPDGYYYKLTGTAVYSWRELL